jgi:hypothetical protein
MRSIRTGMAALAAVGLIGGMAAVAVATGAPVGRAANGGRANGEVVSGAMADPRAVPGSAAAATSGTNAGGGGLPGGDSLLTCERGPVRLSDMDPAPGGYLKSVARGEPDRREFYFARAIYRDTRWGRDVLGDGGPAWSIDYPDADRIMVAVATRLSNLDACEWELPISLADPDLRRYPFLYSLEWGYADLSEAEVVGLREYLLAGGFLMLDDFWGSAEWAIFERQIGRVLPGMPIVDIPRDHILFRIYYEVEEEILQVPNVGNGRAVGRGVPGARTSERDGYVAHLRGIFDDRGRLMVAINWNTDLGDALEWAEDAAYPLEFSAFASRLFMNHIIYSMTH